MITHDNPITFIFDRFLGISNALNPLKQKGSAIGDFFLLIPDPKDFLPTPCLAYHQYWEPRPGLWWGCTMPNRINPHSPSVFWIGLGINSPLFHPFLENRIAPSQVV